MNRAYESALANAIETARDLFRASGEPRRVNETVIEFLKYEGDVGITDPEGPSCDAITDALSHGWHLGPDDDPGEIVYVHFAGMLANSLLDMMYDYWSMKDWVRHPPEVGEETNGTDTLVDFKEWFSTTRPGTITLRDAIEYVRTEENLHPLTRETVGANPNLALGLWSSLTHWKNHYARHDQVQIGKYWIHVHLGHLQKFGKLFRSEFLAACVWNKTADWAIPYKEVYGGLPENEGLAIPDAIEAACCHGVSPIRLLTDECGGDIDEADWYQGLKWCDPFADLPVGLYIADEGGPSGLLNTEEEKRLNESLLRAFGNP